MDKLKLVYQFANSKGIKTANLGWVFTSHHSITAPSTTTAIVSVTKILVPHIVVDWIISAATTLSMEDTPLSLTPINKVGMMTNIPPIGRLS